MHDDIFKINERLLFIFPILYSTSKCQAKLVKDALSL